MLPTAPSWPRCSLRMVSFRAIGDSSRSVQQAYNRPAAVLSIAPLKKADTGEFHDGIEPYLQDYVREPGQGLRGLCAQSQSRHPVRFRRDRGAGIWRPRPRWSLDPGEERIKSEFAGVKRSYLPLQSIIRIDEVRKQGVSKIVALEGSNVAQFPGAAAAAVGRWIRGPKKT